MSESESNIIPFGKYKGRPFGVVLEDDNYSEWLMMQPWFESKFPKIHETLKEKFAIPEDTPRHNELQARFLDDVLCRKLFHLCNDDTYNKIKDKTPKRFVHTKGGGKYKKYFLNIEDNKQVEVTKEKYDRVLGMVYAGVKISFYRYFEYRGWDVALGAGAFHFWVDIDSDEENLECQYRVPIKLAIDRLYIKCIPVLGDDYPSILRRMRYHAYPPEYDGHTPKVFNVPMLVIDEYNGAGVTFDKVDRIFTDSEVPLVVFDDLKKASTKKNWCLI